MCRPLKASICWRTNPGLRFPGNPYVPHCFQMFTNRKLIWVRQGYKDIWIMTRTTIMTFIPIVGFLRDSVGKESACNARDKGLIAGLGRSPGEGNGNPLQYSRLENPKDRGAWQAVVHEVSRVRHNLVTKPPSQE